MPTISRNLEHADTVALNAFLEAVPRELELVIERPAVSALINSGLPKENIEACLAIEIAKCANMLTVGGNLRQGQSLEIAKELIATYPNESLEDFCYCLRNGIKGRYSDPGKTFRFDILVIFEWFKAYQDEKYQAIEEKMMREKDPDSYRHLGDKKEDGKKGDQEFFRIPRWYATVFAPVLNPSMRRYLILRAWTLSQSKIQSKKQAPMSDEDVLKEGQKTKRASYIREYSDDFTRMKLMISVVAKEFFKDYQSFNNFSMYSVKGHDIFAESEQRAIEIYEIAATRLNEKRKSKSSKKSN